MEIFVIGLNHNSAPIEIREVYAISKEELGDLYNTILAHNSIYEALILSTCNRVEIYYANDNTHDDSDFIINSLFTLKGVTINEAKDYFYKYKSTEALKHIFEVAAGIDSMVLGEPQIFGQVKDAFISAKEYNAARQILKKLEEVTIVCTKKIRTYTKISEKPLTISSAAIDLAKKIYGSLANRNALIVGAGQMCELAAKYLKNEQLNNIYVTNRTYERAKILAESIGGKAIEFQYLYDLLSTVDIVISSTASNNYILEYSQIEKKMPERKHRPLLLIDIAVPRDIDPKINGIENVYVYDIDDLQSVVELNRKTRIQEIEKAQFYINEAIDNYYKWLKSLNIAPVIVGIKNYFEQSKDEEIKRLQVKLKLHNSEDLNKINRALEDYAKKLLHKPIMNIKLEALNENKYTIIDAVKILFGLDYDKKD
jgi:glutamyl-tRNA reductase